MLCFLTLVLTNYNLRKSNYTLLILIMASHNELGKIGEQLATDYLLTKGYEILARNFIYQKAEVDIN